MVPTLELVLKTNPSCKNRPRKLPHKTPLKPLDMAKCPDSRGLRPFPRKMNQLSTVTNCQGTVREVSETVILSENEGNRWKHSEKLWVRRASVRLLSEICQRSVRTGVYFARILFHRGGFRSGYPLLGSPPRRVWRELEGVWGLFLFSYIYMYLFTVIPLLTPPPYAYSQITLSSSYTALAVLCVP